MRLVTRERATAMPTWKPVIIKGIFEPPIGSVKPFYTGPSTDDQQNHGDSPKGMEERSVNYSDKFPEKSQGKLGTFH